MHTVLPRVHQNPRSMSNENYEPYAPMWYGEEKSCLFYPHSITHLFLIVNTFFQFSQFFCHIVPTDRIEHLKRVRPCFKIYYKYFFKTVDFFDLICYNVRCCILPYQRF